MVQKVRGGAAGTACLCSVMPRSSARRPEGQRGSEQGLGCELPYSQVWCLGWSAQRLGSARTRSSASVQAARVSRQHGCLRAFGLLARTARDPERACQRMLSLAPSLPCAFLCGLKRSPTCPDPRRGGRDRPPLSARGHDSGPWFRTAAGTTDCGNTSAAGRGEPALTGVFRRKDAPSVLWIIEF